MTTNSENPITFRWGYPTAPLYDNTTHQPPESDPKSNKDNFEKGVDIHWLTNFTAKALKINSTNQSRQNLNSLSENTNIQLLNKKDEQIWLLFQRTASIKVASKSRNRYTNTFSVVVPLTQLNSKTGYFNDLFISLGRPTSKFATNPTIDIKVVWPGGYRNISYPLLTNNGVPIALENCQEFSYLFIKLLEDELPPQYLNPTLQNDLALTLPQNIDASAVENSSTSPIRNSQQQQKINWTQEQNDFKYQKIDPKTNTATEIDFVTYNFVYSTELGKKITNKPKNRYLDKTNKPKGFSFDTEQYFRWLDKNFSAEIVTIQPNGSIDKRTFDLFDYATISSSDNEAYFVFKRKGEFKQDPLYNEQIEDFSVVIPVKILCARCKNSEKLSINLGFVNSKTLDWKPSIRLGVEWQDLVTKTNNEIFFYYPMIPGQDPYQDLDKKGMKFKQLYALQDIYANRQSLLSEGFKRKRNFTGKNIDIKNGLDPNLATYLHEEPQKNPDQLVFLAPKPLKNNNLQNNSSNPSAAAETNLVEASNIIDSPSLNFYNLLDQQPDTNPPSTYAAAETNLVEPSNTSDSPSLNFYNLLDQQPDTNPPSTYAAAETNLVEPSNTSDSPSLNDSLAELNKYFQVPNPYLSFDQALEILNQNALGQNVNGLRNPQENSSISTTHSPYQANTISADTRRTHNRTKRKNTNPTDNKNKN